MFISINITAIKARIYPSIRDPVSPINIFAGEMLNRKNAIRDPISAAERMVSCMLTSLPSKTNQKLKATEDIIVVIAHKPSMPSIKLTAFIIVMKTNMVSKTLTQ